VPKCCPDNSETLSGCCRNQCPDATEIRKMDITNNQDKITIFFSSNRKEFKCPNCDTPSTEITTYFHRTIQDLPIINKALFLNIRLKKFRCSNIECTTKVFSENIDELALTKQRKTNRLNEHLTSFALTNSAEGAAKLLRSYNNIHVSGDTLLRLAKSVTFEINTNEIDAIGIDDFALKKNINTELFLLT